MLAEALFALFGNIETHPSVRDLVGGALAGIGIFGKFVGNQRIG